MQSVAKDTEASEAVNPWVKVPFFNKQQQTKYAAADVASMAAEIVESHVKLTSRD